MYPIDRRYVACRLYDSIGSLRLWDRDINACDNIFKIAFCDCSGCKRPVVFDRSEQKGCKNVSHVS
jgi:hypothetical protein